MFVCGFSNINTFLFTPIKKGQSRALFKHDGKLILTCMLNFVNPKVPSPISMSWPVQGSLSFAPLAPRPL